MHSLLLATVEWCDQIIAAAADWQIQGHYRAQCRAIISAMREYVTPEDCTYVVPTGGMFLFLQVLTTETVCQSVCLSVCLCVCLSVCVSVCLSVCLSAFLVCLSPFEVV